MASEGQAAIAGAVAPYVIMGIIVVGVAWYINDKFGLITGLQNSLAADNAIASRAATNYGSSQSAAAVGPEVEYDAARTAYARSIGWAGQILDTPGWPDYSSWQGGAGPNGFTFGSTNYPIPATPSLISSIYSAL